MQIIKIIRHLFPDLTDELDKHGSTHPLCPIDFISRILVPETARLLIKDDLNVSDEEALNILTASQRFGAALHPDADTDNDT